MSDALKPILLVITGLVFILLYAAVMVFESEIGFWIALIACPIMCIQFYIWTARGE